MARTSHAATSGPTSGLNAPPVASASVSASRSSRSVSSLTTRPGLTFASQAPSRDGCGRCEAGCSASEFLVVSEDVADAPAAVGLVLPCAPLIARVPESDTHEVSTRNAALSRDISEDDRNTLHRSSWRATTSTRAFTIVMPSPPHPMMSTRVPIAGKDERHIGGTEGTAAPS